MTWEIARSEKEALEVLDNNPGATVAFLDCTGTAILIRVVVINARTGEDEIYRICGIVAGDHNTLSVYWRSLKNIFNNRRDNPRQLSYVWSRDGVQLFLSNPSLEGIEQTPEYLQFVEGLKGELLCR